MAVVAGIDSSTQSCTVELRDADSGRLLGSGRAPHPSTQPPVSEQDPQSWWQALLSAWPQACADAGIDPRDVQAIAVAAQGHGMVCLDAAGDVVRPAKLWNDTASSPQADAMVRDRGKRWWADHVGSVPTAAFTITKLAWLAQNEPASLARIRSVLVPADWLAFRLTGERATDRSNASSTGYYSAHEDRWLADVLTDLVGPGDWEAALPAVHGPAQGIGVTTASAAAALGVRQGVPVGPGAVDQQAGFLGLGLTTGDVLYSLGTSGVVMTSSPRPVHDAQGWVNGVADAAGGYLPLVCTLNATKVTDTVGRLLGVGYAELAELAMTAPRDADRPVLAAFFDGERSPDRPLATGALVGLTNATTREQIALAAVEGVLLGLVRGQDALASAGADVSGSVVVAGGGARSAAYRQVLADLLGCPVLRLDAPEATARGAAVQAAAVLTGSGVEEVAGRWRPDRVDVTEPRVTAADVRGRYVHVADWDGLDRDVRRGVDRTGHTSTNQETNG